MGRGSDKIDSELGGSQSNDLHLYTVAYDTLANIGHLSCHFAAQIPSPTNWAPVLVYAHFTYLLITIRANAAYSPSSLIASSIMAFA